MMRRIIPRCGGFLNIRSHRAATRGGGLRAPAAAAVTNPLASDTRAVSHSEAANTQPNEVPHTVPAIAGASHASEVEEAALQRARSGPEGISRAQHAERAEQQAKQQQEREFEDAQEIGEVNGAHQVWESMDAERVEECLQAAMRAGGKALNTSRLNIVGEGRAGKTAWLRAVSNLPYIQTDSTIGVQQTLLEVNKTDMKVDGDGRSWAKVDGDSGAIMKVEEAQKRLAAEIALQETPEERRLREERRQKASSD